jgi:hypothetical protein
MVIKCNAKEGSEKGCRPQKKINFNTVKKKLSAGVPLTAIVIVVKREKHFLAYVQGYHYPIFLAQFLRAT